MNGTTPRTHHVIRKIIYIIFMTALLTASVRADSGRIDLPPAEMAWLQEHASEVEVLFGYEAPPNAFHDEDGNYVGLLVDFMRELEQEIGTTFTMRDFTTWNDLIEYSKTGSGFVVVGIARTAQRAKYLSFTAPFIKVPYIIVTEKKSQIQSMADLKGASVCTVANYAINDYLAEFYPGIHPAPVSDNLEGLQAVSTGKYDAAIINQMYASHIIHTQGLTNLKFAGQSGYMNRLCAATSVSDHTLFSILDKAVDRIGPDRRDDLYHRWVHASAGRTPKIPLWLSAGTAMVSVLAVSAWLWGWSLRRSIRKQTRQLRQSEQRYATYVEHSPYAILIADAEGRYVDANTAASKLLGFSKNELLTMSIEDITAPAAVERAMNSFRHLKEHKTLLMEDTFLHKNGSHLEVILNAVVLDNDRYMAFCRDISEFKRMQESLVINEARFKSITQVSIIGFLMLALDGRILEVNNAYCEMSGYAFDEVIGMNVWELDTTIGKDEMLKRIARIVEQGEDRFTSAHARKNAEVYDVEISASYVSGYDQLVVFINDISKRVRAVDELADSEQRHRTIFENSPLGLIRYNTEGIISDCNSRFIQLMGSSYEELIGFNALESSNPEMNECVRKALDGQMSVYENEYTSETGGKTTQIRVVFNPVNMGRSPTEVIATLEDITERKAQEEALRRAKEQAEIANSSKSRFLANMSHEIRTPLNGVLGMLQLIQTTELEAAQKEFVDIAIQSSTRLTHLLSDILDLSRVEAGRLDISMEPFDFMDTIDSIKHLFTPSISEKELELLLEIDPGIPEQISGDSVRLQQILSNLVGNAIKFTQNGSISLAVSRLHSYEPDVVRLFFTVRDTGIGIADDKVDTLFDAFTQADSEYTRKFQGAGLGLAITQRLVSLMGGSISVESVPGEGSAFHFSLPFGLVSTENDTDADAKKTKQSGPLKVLLAEDDFVSQYVTLKMFDKLGHKTTIVDNGRQTLERLRQEHFDVILMDVQMPEMDGREATKAIRKGLAGEERQNTPIIAMTAFAMSGDKESLLADGMDDYIAKPIDMEDLVKVLLRVTG